MDPTPPDPHVPSALLAAVALLLWQNADKVAPDTGAALGYLKTSGTGGAEQYITPPGTGSIGDSAWTTSATLPAGFQRRYLTGPTYAVLHGGTLNADGTVAYNGHSYRLRDVWNGAYQEARAVQVA